MKRILLVLLTCSLLILSVNASNVAQAMIDGGTEVSPYYLYTCEVGAALRISGSGVAKCTGSVRVYKTTSRISMRVNLYKKVGSSWIKEVGWTDSCEGKLGLGIEETYTVTEGTYKVVTTAAIIAEDGNYETVSEESDIFSYP